MKKHIHLAFCCLLSSMLFHANAMQREMPNEHYVRVHDADQAIAELSLATQDENAAETRSLCGSRSSKANCGGCQPKDNCCTKLQCRQIITTLDIVESKVCLLTECEPIPLSQSDVVDGVLTINNPGSYGLCEDITANIDITASQVTLDLNCHQVTGEVSIPQVTNGYEDILITNGVIDGNNSAAYGVNIGRFAHNIELSHLTITQATNGIITTQDASNLVISNVLIASCGSTALRLTGIQNVLVTDSVFFRNGGNGLASSSGNNQHVFRNCHAIDNTGVGFNTQNAGRQIYFFNCTARGNDEGGFRSYYTAFNCIADGNSDFGFRLTADSNRDRPSYLQNCIARNNTGDGFEISSDSTGTIKQCLALNNTADGFRHEGASTVQYVSNYAQGNGTNYDPAAGPPFNPFSSTTAGISFWYNTRPA